MPGGGQSQPIAGAGAFLVRSGDHIERKREVRSASGHWTDDPEIAMARQGRGARRGQPAIRHKTRCRLVRIDAAIMRWRAQRTATVRADRQRPETASKRRRRAARGSSWREPKTPRIIGCAVDVVVGLPIAQHQRNIGLAEDDGARILQARDDQGVFLRHEALELRVAPSRRQSGNIEGFFHRHRDAKQCARSAARQRDIGRLGRLARAFEVSGDDGIDAPVRRLDARDRAIRELQRGNLSRPQCGHEIFDRAVIPLRCGKGMGLLRQRPARPWRGRDRQSGCPCSDQNIASCCASHWTIPDRRSVSRAGDAPSIGDGR